MDKNIRILVVDDFATMRRIVKAMLKELGYTNIDEADDGKTALPMIRTGRYDLLVTDWNMPGMTGLDLVKTIRAEEEFADLKIVMVTAEAKREQIIEAAQAGINGYIVKPFKGAAIKEKIEKCFPQ